MKIEKDLNEEQAWQGGGGLNPGKHLLRVIEAGEGTSTGGHPQGELNLEAIQGEEQGGTIRDWIVVTPQSYGKFKALLEAFQMSLPAVGEDFDWSTMVGKVAWGRVSRDLESEKKYNKVVAYISAENIDLPGDVGSFKSGQSGTEDDIPF